MRIRNMDEVIEQIRSYLPDYLEQFGRKVKNNFRCPNEKAHKHGDSNPSAGIVKGNPALWNCFGCGERGDIFLAAHYLEGMELKGVGFIETVRQLAERFEIEIEQDDDAEEILRALDYVSCVIKKGLSAPIVKQYIESRGFMDIAETFGIGYADPDKLRSILLKTYDSDFIHRNELCKTSLFENRMVFPIHDETGEVVGFAGRTLGEDKRKYMNSANSSVFHKSKVLYNLHRIKGKQVYVFEGYTDVWRAYQHGIEAVASCGTAFTEEHLNQLIRHGIKEITFVFDGDEAGRKALDKTLKIVENCYRIQCSYIVLPKGDPDEYLQKYGKDAFLSLEKTIIEEPRKKKRYQFLERLEMIEEKMLSGEIKGYRTGWSRYDYKMENVQKGLHLVGGISNIGKTAWMMQLALRLAELNPNLFVLYASIDDDLQMQIPRVVANLGGLAVNQVKNPKKFIDENPELDKPAKELQWKRREMGNRRLMKLAEQNFAIIDINDVSRLEEMEREIQIYQDITGKQMAFFLDNFHKVRTKSFPNFKERFTYVSEELKRITNQYDLVTFATVELTKLGHDGRPEMENIKESVDIIYDADTVHLLHNDMHSKQGETELKFQDGRLPGKELPIVEVSVTKNKVSGYKGRFYFKFFPEYMTFQECDAKEHEKYRKIEV